MNIHLRWTLGAAWFAVGFLAAAAEPKPAQTGLDPAKLADVSKRLRAFVDDVILRRKRTWAKTERFDERSPAKTAKTARR